MSRATIKEVAQLANVSVGTVSMVLNNSDKIKPETQANVLRAVKQLNYKRNPYARSLSLNKSHAVGLIVTDLTNPYFGMIVEHLQREIDFRSNSMMIGVSQDMIRLEKKLVERLIGSGVDGLIFVPAYARDPDVSHICELVDRSFPMVSISTYYEGVRCGCVMTDLAKGSYDMTRFLLESGHRNILFLCGFRDLVLSKTRLQGFLSAHRDAGLSVRDDQIFEAPQANYQSGYEAAREILKRCAPDAIMSINDVLSMGVLGYLHESGIRVPEDISVAGYDDLIYSSMLGTPLTTVRQPIREMCAAAASMLFSLIEGEKGPEGPVLLEPQLTIRASTRKR